ncbi:MAG: hypothetical protein IJV24_03040 [Prevotella sp.]|nr:hypothetical protein [Prevotella sp.]
MICNPRSFVAQVTQADLQFAAHPAATYKSTAQKLLSDIMRDFKKFTSKQILSTLLADNHESRRQWMPERFYIAGKDDKKISNYRFWQEGTYVETIYSGKFLIQKRDYLHMNPVRAEFVDKPEHDLYSSARNYAGMEGLIDAITT